MVENKIVVSLPHRFEAAFETIKQMLDDESEIVTIMIGEDGSNEEAERLEEALTELNDDIEVEIHEGGQPVYPYLFSVE